MPTRGSAIVRVVTYFRECHIDEARVAFKLVQEVVEGRLKGQKQAKKFQDDAARTPRRKRRTKAEMEAAKAGVVEHKSARGETIPAAQGSFPAA